MIMIMNEHGHYYCPETHTLFNDKNQPIVHFSNASEIYENMTEDDQMAISNLVSRAYKAGCRSSDAAHKKKILELFDLMEE